MSTTGRDGDSPEIARTPPFRITIGIPSRLATDDNSRPSTRARMALCVSRAADVRIASARSGGTFAIEALELSEARSHAAHRS
jgi:hypothetical protein